MPVLPVAVCQMTSVDDVEKNFEQMKSFILSCRRAKILFFPENCIYMRLKEGERISGFHLSDPIFHRLAELAKQNGVSLHLGSVALRDEEKLNNASVFISASGEVSCSYKKIHLFDIALDNQPPVRESDIFHHGRSPSILEYSGIQIGQTICYDLRFAELFSFYAKQSVEIIVVPAAFIVPTGKVHWEVLLRARAIESQAFVIAAAQAGVHRSENGMRETYGHSLVVSPWGEILAEANPHGPEMLELEIDLDLVAKVRRQIPMQQHRRLL